MMNSSEGVQQAGYSPVTEYAEGLPAATFQEYELLCNSRNTSSRKAGILDEGLYQEAIKDPSTVMVTVEGKTVPLIVDIKCGLGLGYEADRARAYAGSEQPVSALAVPLTGFGQEDTKTMLDTISGYSGALYFSDHNGDDQKVLYEGLAERGRTYVEKPLLDSRADNTQAALSLFVCDSENIELHPEGHDAKALADLQRVFDEQVRPTITDPNNAVFMENGANLSQDELSQIWELYQNRFQFLGENHPISMEDDQESFFYVLRQPSTTVAFRRSEGKIVCLADFTQDLSHLYWLNVPYLESQAQAAPDGFTTVFFPGIVANQENQGSSRYVVGLFAEMAAKAGMSARVLFENTNLSERYIPRIVETVTRSTGKFDTQTPQKVDEVDYRLAFIS